MTAADRVKALERLTFCYECGYWHRGYKQDGLGYSDRVGYCDKPYQDKCLKMEDDFCSTGIKKGD